MCMALPGGRGPAPRGHPLQRLAQWAGFAVLIGAMLAVGLVQWSAQRRSAR